MQYLPNAYGEFSVTPEQVAGGTKWYMRLTLKNVTRVYELAVMKNMCIDILNKISQIENSQDKNGQPLTKEEALMKRHNIA